MPIDVRDVGVHVREQAAVLQKTSACEELQSGSLIGGWGQLPGLCDCDGNLDPCVLYTSRH